MKKKVIKVFIIFKAKNYVLVTEDNKVKYKGSAVKATSKSIALREFINKIIESIIYDRNDYKEIYESYVKEIMNITDISRWSSRKTISEKTLTSERTNESKIRDAMEDSEYVEGDRIRVFYKAHPDSLTKKGEELELQENFSGNYCRVLLLKALHDTSNLFETVLDVKSIFKNYSLVKAFKGLTNPND